METMEPTWVDLHDAISSAKQRVIDIARELSFPDAKGQSEYMHWEIETRDKLRLAVFALDKLEKKEIKKGA